MKSVETDRVALRAQYDIDPESYVILEEWPGPNFFAICYTGAVKEAEAGMDQAMVEFALLLDGQVVGETKQLQVENAAIPPTSCAREGYEVPEGSTLKLGARIVATGGSTNADWTVIVHYDAHPVD